MIILSNLFFWIPVIILLCITLVITKSNKKSFTMILFGSPIFYFMCRILRLTPEQLQNFVPLLIGLFSTIMIFTGHLYLQHKK
ncbi:ATP synthase F0, I subunit domain protein [Enterococcus faecalis 06-MB-DW-09]|nr:ATP synthase F0, I subunit domain protein [Enterococcus faecalis 06-MB-DW-09]